MMGQAHVGDLDLSPWRKLRGRREGVTAANPGPELEGIVVYRIMVGDQQY
jgi:hypothetical protein